MLSTVAKKNTLLRSETKFASVIWTKVWPTSKTENTKRGIVWSCVKKHMHGCVIIDNPTGKHVNKMDGGKIGFIPKLERHGRASK